MLIDMHCHILPGVDDGAKDETESREMLRIAYSEGIRYIIATPHHYGGIADEEWDKRKKALEVTSRMAQEIASDFHVVPGSEIYYSQEAVADLKSGRGWTMNDSKYILVEFPLYAEFTYIRRAVQTLQYEGYLPILAHIERYPALMKDHCAEELAQLGAYLQVNAGSVTGRDGWKVKRYILKLLKSQDIHFIGTDAHGSAYRRPLMKQCASYISKKIEEAYCSRICQENAGKIIRREYIDE